MSGNRVWIDGAPSSDGISVRDLTFLRGDGCFEAVRSYGGTLFDAPAHLARLVRSAAALELPAPDVDEISRWLDVAATAAGDGIIRLVLTRGDGNDPGRVVILVESLPEQPSEFRLSPIEAPWHPAGTEWDLAGVKTVSYAPNMAASRQARRRGAHDALLVHGSLVLEGPTFSVGWVRSGVLETPSLELGILASVTRSHVLAIAEEAGMSIVEGHFSIHDLMTADEVMVWSTLKEVRPVVALDDHEFAPGPVTAELAERFARRVQSMR